MHIIEPLFTYIFGFWANPSNAKVYYFCSFTQKLLLMELGIIWDVQDQIPGQLCIISPDPPLYMCIYIHICTYTNMYIYTYV